ncbi:MAG: translation initiation factor IF-2 [Gemmatimonadetes bacterium]|nr:translation initiation factor IF-2 [Gemmatimonadota bacterium]
MGGQVKVRASGYTSDGKPARKPGPKGRAAKRQSAQQAAKRNVSRIRGQMRGPGRKPRRRQRLTPDQIEERQRQEAAEQERRERERRTVRVAEFLSVAELAELVEETPAALIGSAFRNMGMMVTINQRLDFDQIEMLLDEFNFNVEREETLEVVEDIDPYGIDSETAEPRPPVVTVMGHVDHGKTLLLDRIRKANVVAGEAGGITQHIGAYHVQLPSGRVTFLDTPGHAAFTAMRARGADVTDIVILLVAADDSVMPQTVEAINHASSAGVPLVVAVNKCDLPGVDPDRVKRQLLQHSVQVDDLGGEVLSANVSAKTGKGIDDLLEQVLLQAELMEDKLRADPRRRAVCTVVEARLDVGKGPVVTVLVQGGTLRVGDTFVCGLHQGRVRAMHDERGMPVKEAGPSIPVQVLGAGGVPQAGDPLQVMEPSRAQARVSELQQLDREKQMRLRERAKKIGDFAQLTQADGMIEVPILVKGDVDGSVQALADAFEQIGGEEDGVRVRIVHRGVGAINESDVLLAQTTEAVIIGFGVRPQAAARKQAEDAAVEIRTYDIIYKAVDDLTRSLEGRLSPDQVEHVEGSAQVRETFRVSKVGMIAGCYVVQGRVNRKFRIRVIREGKTVFEGEIASLRRFKDDAREVREGFECGIGIANFNDVKVGDEIECYTVEEIARKLAKAS